MAVALLHHLVRVSLSAVFCKMLVPSLRAYPSMARSFDLPLRPWLALLRWRVLEHVGALNRAPLRSLFFSKHIRCLASSTALPASSTPLAAPDPFAVYPPYTLPAAAHPTAPVMRTGPLSDFARLIADDPALRSRLLCQFRNIASPWRQTHCARPDPHFNLF